MSAPPVLCKYERHPDCRVACRDKNKSCHRPTVVKFKQTVQEMTFLEQRRPAMIGTALHCTIRELPLKPPSGAEICHSQVTQTEAVQELTHTPYSFGQGITFDMLSHAQSMLNEVSQTPTGQPIINFLRLSEWSTMPKRGTPHSAGMDVTAAEDRTIAPWSHAVISTGHSAVAPPGTYIRVAPRSGLALKHGLSVGAGVVDADYRGDIGVVLFNHTGVAYSVTTRDRIAQLICEQCVLPTVWEVTSMDDTSRGAAGFGSTGTSVLTSPSPLRSTFVFSILQYQMMAHIAGCMLYYAFTRAVYSNAVTVWAISKAHIRNQQELLNALLFGNKSSPVYTQECTLGLRNGVPAMYSKMVDHLLHEYEGVTRPNEKPFSSREPSQPRQPGAGTDLSDQAWWDSSSECGTEEMTSDEDTASESSVSLLKGRSK